MHRALDDCFLAQEQQVVVHHLLRGDPASRAVPGDDLEGLGGGAEGAESGKQRGQQQRQDAGAGAANGVRGQGNTEEGHDDDASVGNLKSELLDVQQREKAETEIREHGKGVRHRRLSRRFLDSQEDPAKGDESQ